MKTNPLKLATAALTFCLLAGSMFAADQKSLLNAGDEKFVKTTAEAGKTEVSVADLGGKKASRADVKELAAMLSTHHNAMNTELETLAKAKGVAISTITPSDVAKDLEKEETGEAFDKAFLKQLASSHKDSIDAFEDAQKDASDADVKAFIDKNLPTLRDHLRRVEELQKK